VPDMKFIPLAIAIMISGNAMCVESEHTSIINIVSNSEKYDGKSVIIGGYLSLEFEGSAIYLSKDDWSNLITKNGLWCQIDIGKYKDFDNKYVFVEGIISASKHGHMGLWSAQIDSIKRVWSSPPRK
jgi:hypothetical protein